MPKYTLNGKGQLVDSDGNVFAIDGSDVTVENAVTKEAMETTIEDRLKRLRAAKGEADSTIKNLQAQEGRSKELDKMLSTAQNERDSLADDLETAKREQSTAKKTAEKDVQKQMQAYKEDAVKSKADLIESNKARESERLTNMILKKCGSAFRDPSRDVIPQMLSTHKREQKRDEDGNAVEGEFADLFDIEHLDKDGKTLITKSFLLDKAVEVFAENPNNAHYRKDTKLGGSGGSDFLKQLRITDPEKMTSHEKIAEGINKREYSQGILNPIEDSG